MSDRRTQDWQHSGKNRWVAAVLAYFLGVFGGQKFYLGQHRRGLYYALFCWTAVPLILSLAQGVHYVLMSDEEFHRRLTMDEEKLEHWLEEGKRNDELAEFNVE